MEVYKGDFIFAGGCEYESETSHGTLIYKISHFAIKKNNLFLIRHWRIPEIISSKENLSTSNKSWSDFIDIVSHKFLARAPMNRDAKGFSRKTKIHHMKLILPENFSAGYFSGAYQILI